MELLQVDALDGQVAQALFGGTLDVLGGEDFV